MFFFLIYKIFILNIKNANTHFLLFMSIGKDPIQNSRAEILQNNKERTRVEQNTFIITHMVDNTTTVVIIICFFINAQRIYR